MPEISRFFGIVIAIYFNDHAPPHFHAKYGEHKAKIAIADGTVIDGRLPKRALSLVEEWRKLQADDLSRSWAAIMERRSFEKIEPLE